MSISISSDFYTNKLQHFLGKTIILRCGRDSLVTGPLARETTGGYMVGEYPGLATFEKRDIRGVFDIPTFDSCLIEVKDRLEPAL